MNKAERNQQIADSTAPVADVCEQFSVSRSTYYRIKREAEMAQAALRPWRSESYAESTMGRQPLFSQTMRSGVSYHGGQVTEEFQRELQDDQGVRLYTEMATHPVVAAVLFAIEMAQRQVNWFVEPASDKAADQKAAEFVDECREDMAQTWDDVVSQVFTMLTYGYSVCELVYKKRLGQEPGGYVKDAAKSRFNDGRIGWRRWQFISPKSMPAGNRWTFDEWGRVQEIHQQPAPDYVMRTLPVEKSLIFRTTVKYDNPEPPPILRAMYGPFYYATNLAEVEAIGAERLGVGLPVAYMGAGTKLQGDGNDYDEFQNIVRNIRTDEQMGIVIPFPKLGTAAEGQGALLELMSPPSSGFVDFNEVIERYEKRMAMTVLAQFIFLGMLQVGTQALNRSATDTFQMSISAWSDMLADVVNRFAIPRLMALNPFKLEQLPQLAHSEIGVPDLTAMADYVNKLVGTQVLTPDDELEAYLRELANFPEKPEPEVEIVETGLETEGEEETPPEFEVEGEEGEGEEEAPEEGEIEIEEEASEMFALKTIRGALARDMQTGEFQRGSGAPMSDKDVALGDALAFGRMSGSQARELAEAGMLAGKDGKYRYTEAGKQLSRELRSNPRAAMDKLLKKSGRAETVKGAAPKGRTGIAGKAGKKGGGGGAGDKAAANRAAAAESGALQEEGVTSGHLDALAGLKAGEEPDAELMGHLQDKKLVDADGVMTSAGRSLLSGANAGDIDRVKKALRDAKKPKGGAKKKPKAKPKGKPAPKKPEAKPAPVAAKRLQDAGMEERDAGALLDMLGQEDPDAAANELDDDAKSALLEVGLLDEVEDGVGVSEKGRQLQRLIEDGDWDAVRELLGAEESASGNGIIDFASVSDEKHTGIMLAFAVPEDDAKQLALSPDDLGKSKSIVLPPKALHLTLAFLGDSSEMELTKDIVVLTLGEFASKHQPVTGVVGGVGRFDNDEGDGLNAFYASFDSPILPAWRQSLIEVLNAIGLAKDASHGFTPHITLAYLAPDEKTPQIDTKKRKITFDSVVLAWGNDVTHFKLKGKESSADLIDEQFALRLKRGGPKWERATNAYEMELRQTYAAWADRTARELSGVEDDADFQTQLQEHVDELVAALILLGRRHLPKAHALGLAGSPATSDGYQDLAAALAENEAYLVDSLGPGLRARVEQRTREETDLRLDDAALAALFLTFLARVGSYAGAHWSLIQLGFGDKVKQYQRAVLVKMRKEQPDVEIRAEEAHVPVMWRLDPSVKNHCATCLAYGDRVYDSWDDMLAISGSVWPGHNTDCGSNCRCSLEAKIGDNWQRAWTHLAKEGAGLPLTIPFSEREDYGGPGSGHHGHKGVPGSRGGSAAGGRGFGGQAGFMGMGGATGRALHSGDIAIDREKYEALPEDARRHVVAHEIVHQTVEPHVLKNMDEWDRAEKILLVKELPGGQKLFVGGQMSIGEAVAESVAVTITGDKFGNLSDSKMAEIRGWAKSTTQNAGYSIGALRADTDRIFIQLESEL